MHERNRLKKFMTKDRFGNSFSYEFDVPPMENKIPPAFQPGPKGTDTVPAWLTPGENVINAEASRKFQPMIDKMNEYGRQVQKMQGGPVPSYAQEGEFVSKITPQVLDALMQVESGGDVNAVSPVGASGPYQIMKDTALNPGYGVTPISLEDRFNPTIARNFADSYLKGIEKANPNFSLDQILQSYHSGVGNVLKNNLGSEGKAYAPKVNAELKKADSGFTFPSFISSAEASTLDNKDKKVSKDSGSWLDSLERSYYNIKKIPSMIGEGIDYIKDKTDAQEKKEDSFYEIYETKNEIKQIDIDIEQTKNQLESAPEGSKPRIKKKLDELLKTRGELEVNLRKAGKTFDGVPDMGGYKPDDFSLFGKKKDGSDKSATDVVNETLGDDEAQKKKSVKVAKDIESIVGDDPSGGAVVAELYKQDENTLMNKGLSIGKEALSTVSGWFEDTFKDMFSGPELARMAIIYAGSRAMGYDHGGSLNYSMKNYLKRVDSQAAAAKKFALSEKARDDFTLDSLKKYAETRDINDLVAKPTTGLNKKMTGKGYLRGYGQVTLFEDSNKTQYARIGGKDFPTANLLIEQWDDKVHGDVAVSKRFGEFEKDFLSSLNSGLDSDNEEYVKSDLVGSVANKRYREILRQNGISLNEAPATEIAMQDAIKDYYTAMKQWQKDGKPEKEKPQSLIAFINRKVFTPLTGVPQSVIAGASVANLNKLSNMIKADMSNKNPQSKAYRDEFMKGWEGVLTAFRALPNAEKDKYIRQGADTDGHSAFTLFFQDKGIDGIEAILKS